MARPAPTPLPALCRWFDASVLVAGLLLLGGAIAGMVRNGTGLELLSLLCVPLTVVIARFPMVLDRAAGSVEVGFDSTILMFLLCTLQPYQAIVVWALGVVASQLVTDKRALYKSFNIGLGIIGGAVSAAVLHALRGPGLTTPQELVAVAAAAAGYFVTDFLLSALTLSMETRSPLRDHVLQRGTLLAIACFVPFDSLGYLGAVMLRSAPWWTLLLLGVPLVVLLFATRAVSRGSENARRLQVLFDAAVRAQTLTDPGQVLDALVEDARKLLRIDQVEVRATPPGPHEIGAKLRDGQRDRWLVAPGRHRARSTSAHDKQGLDALVAVSSDAFSRLRLTEDMTHLARHDLLTNLPNRGLLLDRVQHALQVSRRRGAPISLLFVDLDGFKPVNDRFGHAAGDAVLVDVAKRLRRCVRESDTVARLGGDEFAILLEDCDPAEVDTACHRVLTALSEPAFVAGHELTLSASIGVAFGDDTETSESMLRNADLAMYEAKSRGKDQFVHYEGALGQSRLERLELVESLRASIAAEDLSLVYQPVVRAATGRITGVEALARWRSNGKDVPPDVFIRVAEESGLILPLGDVVLNKAAEATAALREAAGDVLAVGVNISPQQLREPGFVGKVQAALEKTAGANLILELTERDGVGDDEISLGAMRRLAELGVSFAIDDFGVGFSSIGYLQDLPIAIIKTDRVFSDTIDRDERSCSLLCSITMMGQALGLDVVVEGIERESQLEHVRDHVHAPFAQGYLMYRPMPLEEMVAALEENRRMTDPEQDTALLPGPEPAAPFN